MLEQWRVMVNFLESKLDSKYGGLVLGLGFGLFLLAVSLLVTQSNSNLQKDVIEDLRVRVLELKVERDAWQERAFEADAKCLNQVQLFLKFSEDIKETQARREILLRREKSIIDKYEKSGKK